MRWCRREAYNVITISFATCDFPCELQHCMRAIWTNEYLFADVSSFEFTFHWSRMAWQRSNTQHIRMHYHLFHETFAVQTSDCMFWASSGYNYDSERCCFFRTIMICVAILLANFYSHRQFFPLFITIIARLLAQTPCVCNYISEEHRVAYRMQLRP